MTTAAPAGTMDTQAPPWRQAKVISPARAKQVAEAGYPKVAAALAPESACTRDGVDASGREYTALAGVGCAQRALWSRNLPLSQGHVPRPCEYCGEHEIDQDLAVLAAGVDNVLHSAEYQRVFASDPATGAWSCLDKACNPFPPLSKLEGDDTGGLFGRLVAAVGRLGYHVRLTGEDIAGMGASGEVRYARREIVISQSLSSLHRAKTAAHEVAHAITQISKIRPFLTSNEAELIAEATAWLVMRRCGEDTGSFSFPFIAKYGAVRAGKELLTCCAVAGTQGPILLAAAHITAAISQIS